MQVCIFGWMPRETEPLFGGQETNVYLGKTKMDTIDEDKIRKLMDILHDEYSCDTFKFIFYPNNSPQFSQVWER